MRAAARLAPGWTLEAVMSELAEIEREEPEPQDGPDVLERRWRGKPKYVCSVCGFHNIDNREAVEDHIERAH